MDRYVADPHWHGLIVWYFFLGGIASGAYAVASLAAIFGDEDDRRATRAAYYVAFPLVCVCGLLLIVDLGRPERFLHMMIQSNTWRPMLKWWSPMSAGSWGLSLFGGFSFISFLCVLAEDGRLGLGRWSSLAKRLGQGRLGRVFQAMGTLAGFFLGAYTGTLLSATNQPIWSDTSWLSALFLVSATSTGIAAILVVGPMFGGLINPSSVGRLERLDRFAIVLELLMLGAFAASVGRWAGPIFLRWPGMLVPGFVVPVGLIAPLILQRWSGRSTLTAASVLALAGGFALRAAVVGMPVPFLVAAR